MADDSSRREHMLRPNDTEMYAIRRWIAYKLAQAKRAAEHYRTIPRRLRTPGDENGYRYWLNVASGLRWAMPGGRGDTADATDTAE